MATTKKAIRIFDFKNPGVFYPPVALYELSAPHNFMDMTHHIQCSTKYLICSIGYPEHKTNTMAFLASSDIEEAKLGQLFGDITINNLRINRYSFYEAEMKESESMGFSHKDCLLKLNIELL